MNLRRCEHANSCVSVLVVVPVKERSAKSPLILNRAESIRELWPILHGLELRFRKGVVVAHMGATVRLRDAQIGQQKRDWLRCHTWTAVSMDRQLPLLNILAAAGLGDESCCKRCHFSMCNHPTHNISAENVHNHIEIEVGPFRWPQELGNVP